MKEFCFRGDRRKSCYFVCHDSRFLWEYGLEVGERINVHLKWRRKRSVQLLVFQVGGGEQEGGMYSLDANGKNFSCSKRLLWKGQAYLFRFDTSDYRMEWAVSFIGSIIFYLSKVLIGLVDWESNWNRQWAKTWWFSQKSKEFVRERICRLVLLRERIWNKYFLLKFHWKEELDWYKS